MATYAELHTMHSDGELLARIMVACIVAAEEIRTEAGSVQNHANRLLWAKEVFRDPGQEARRMLMAVLAQHKTSTVNQIRGASDAAMQSAVNAAVDVFATGGG